MGYLHISNLYKDQSILAFKECYALEKIHGTSAHISWRAGKLGLFSGGCSHERFVQLFDLPTLTEKFQQLGHDQVTVYGEAYGGKLQGMSGTYGKELRFIAFDVKVGDTWVSVPDMDQIATGLGLEVVAWELVPTEVEMLDQLRDAPSVQASRNGCGEDQQREGIILRPPFEVTRTNGERIIAKHKQDSFSERATPQKIVDPETLKILEEANAIAVEWVTEMRLSHVLDKLGDVSIEGTSTVIQAMVEDILREAAGEIVDSKAARRAIGTRTAKMFKQRLNQQILRSAVKRRLKVKTQ